jgi:hypothetical protein
MANADTKLSNAQIQFRQPFMEQAAGSHMATGGGRPTNVEIFFKRWSNEAAARKKQSPTLKMQEIYEDIAAQNTADVRDG